MSSSTFTWHVTLTKVFLQSAAEQKVCYFRVASARKTAVCLLNGPRQAVSNVICLFKELGNDGRRPGSERKCTVKTSSNSKAIEKRVQRNPRVSMIQIARVMGMRDRWMRRIAKTKLGLKNYKMRKVQLLTEKNKLVRLGKYRKLLRRTASHLWERFLFTDMNIFMVQQVHNSPNNIIWCMDASSTSAFVEHRQYPKSIMV
ncbi:uncharacterized protein TNCV_4917941 [Trichonephila clavipes]|nr:uncharacterized protein TNCV_4917941 [Trichonephila clavipes]